MSNVSITIPVFNESALIKNVCLKLLYDLDNSEIIDDFKIISFGFGLDLHISAFISAVLLSSLIISISITPFSIGTFHLVAIYALLFWILDETLVLDFSIFICSLIMLITISYGIISLVYIQFIKKS